MKIDWKPGTLIYPLPAVLISLGSDESSYNLLTVSWVGTLCTDPPLCYISVRPERYSHPILCREMEFAINLTTKAMAYAVDWCGVRSGRQYNKFEEIPLTPAPSKVIKAPIVKESPLSIECRVREVIPLGSHDMFLSEVVHVQVEDSLLDPETGAFQLMNADLLAYSHGFYHELGPLIGRFGWSVRKKK